MLTRHLTSKIIDIRLDEEKFYFPGETIKGLVIIHPKSVIKVNLIQLKFSGQVHIHLKEKETTTLFEDTIILSACPTSPNPKQTTLETKEYAFPFQFVVPKNLNLPSSMEFGKKGHIRYTINALLDRPMLPESLCPKVEYAVSLLEYIDIEKPQFKVPQEKYIDIMLPNAKYNQKCMVKASMPRLGFTRGDIVPLKVTVDYFTSFVRKDGVTVELVRTVEIRTTKHTVFKETKLKTTPYPVNIKAPNYSQAIICQISIPTSTPPSIRYKDKMIRFHYKIRVSVSFGERNTYHLDLPIVIGTWPRAAVPIEDDDDAFAHDIKDSVLTDEEDEDVESIGTNSLNGSHTSSSILPSWHTNNSSTSTITNNQNRYSNGNISSVGRSDSKASDRSFNSFKSTRSWEYNNQTNNLTRNTSQSTTLSSPDRLPSYYSDSSYPNHHNMNRRSRYINSNHSPVQLANDVPTHILEPLPNHFIPLTSPIHEQQEPETYHSPYIQQDTPSSSDDSEDDDDLLAIVKRKERKEKKLLKKSAL